jgi:hypothetical protein
MGKNISFSLSEPNACCGFKDSSIFSSKPGSITCEGEAVVKLQFPSEDAYQQWSSSNMTLDDPLGSNLTGSIPKDIGKLVNLKEL